MIRPTTFILSLLTVSICLFAGCDKSSGPENSLPATSPGFGESKPEQGAAATDRRVEHPAKWYTDLETAKAEAAKSGRLVLVYFKATWCVPCQMYARDVFPKEEFKKTAADFVFVSIDVDKEKEIAERFEVKLVPTFAIMTPRGRIVHRFEGYLGLEDSLREMKKGIRKAG